VKWLYLVLATIGAAIPYSLFSPWLMVHGPNVRLLLVELFSTPLSAFFGADVLISAIVVITFIRREGARRGIRHLWAPIAATCLVGVSCGLPLFLYLRERGSKGDT
jgi:hypothetical protein